MTHFTPQELLRNAKNTTPASVAEHYAAAVDAARAACDADITLLPAVIERKLAFYDTCFDIALQHGDRHGANNWGHCRQMLQDLRAQRAAHNLHATTEGRCHDHA